MSEGPSERKSGVWSGISSGWASVLLTLVGVIGGGVWWAASTSTELNQLRAEFVQMQSMGPISVDDLAVNPKLTEAVADRLRKSPPEGLFDRVETITRNEVERVQQTYKGDKGGQSYWMIQHPSPIPVQFEQSNMYGAPLIERSVRPALAVVDGKILFAIPLANNLDKIRL